ncbi:excinuclease ABC, A subunit domain protein, partial [Chlamydia psittaci 84-8471/1]
ARNAKE